MQNNIRKAPVKFLEDLLYFQHCMQNFVYPTLRGKRGSVIKSRFVTQSNLLITPQN